MLSHLPGPSLGGRQTLYTPVTVPFLRPEHSVTDSGGGRGPMLCFPGSAQLSGPSKLTPFIIHYLAESMHGITASKETFTSYLFCPITSGFPIFSSMVCISMIWCLIEGLSLVAFNFGLFPPAIYSTASPTMISQAKRADGPPELSVVSS